MYLDGVSRAGSYSHSGAQRQDIFLLALHRKLMKAPDTLPRLGQFPSSILFRQNNICMSAVLSSQYGATTAAAENLRAQLHSQGQHEIEILKAKEPAPYV
jgi:hypothetical protein